MSGSPPHSGRRVHSAEGGSFWRLLNPRAAYRPGEPRCGRGWWALFIAGVFAVGIPSLVAMLIVSSDKKFLKQMALAIFYMNAALTLASFAVGATGILPYTEDISGQTAFGIAAIATTAGVVGMTFGLGVAACAQLRIDRIESGAYNRNGL